MVMCRRAAETLELPSPHIINDSSYYNPRLGDKSDLGISLLNTKWPHNEPFS